jgi:sugar phosphate permease
VTEQISEATRRKLMLRIVGFSLVLYIFQYLDRVNLGFAALQMNTDLGLSPIDFGVAASVFSVAYVLFEVPSGMLLYRFGPRLWIARILLTWGLVSASLCFVRSALQLDVTRFLLGVAEAGFYPGIIYYVAQWVPVRERARALANMSSAGPLAIVLGGPVSGLVMSAMDGLGGISGWRWLFIVEGLPVCGLGILAYWLMADRPQDVGWLDDAEKATLSRALAAEHEQNRREQRHNFLDILRNPLVLLLGVFGICFNSSGVSYWLPQIVNAMGTMTKLQVGCITAIPYLCAFLLMRQVGRYADRTGRSYLTLVGCCMAGSVGFVSGALLPPVPGLIGMCLGTTGIWSYAGPYWALATSMLTGPAAAGGTALLNSILQIGSIVIPFTVGWITSLTHTFTGGVLFLASVPAVGLALAPLIHHIQVRQRQRAAAGRGAPAGQR